MVVEEASINNIMGGIESTGGVRLHNHKRKLKQRFDIIKKLGQGTYGKVQLGINKETGQEVAIKTIKKSKIETEADLVRIRREIQIMSSVQHPNIIHIYEVFENREKMVLVMEYAAGGELYDYLSERKVLQEEEARRIFRQISTACYYCHKHKICHRDLKLENILLDEKHNAKIADFGLSNVFDGRRLLSTFCGSPLYASPEIVKGTPYHGPEVDCWSLGVLLYTLVYGAMPFDGSNFKRLVRQISQGDYFEPKTPSPASPLIKEMLTVNPRNRANIEKICMHWWVNETYDENCLDISEELANQTPVRLDLLLSLAPPPPQLESDQMVVAGEQVPEEPIKADMMVPTRSQSVGSIMDLGNPAERRIKDLIAEELKVSPKRKLEMTVSTDHVNVNDGKRKEKIVKEHTIADISLHNQEGGEKQANPLTNSATVTLSKEMEVEELDPSMQGAACAEIMEEAKKKQPVKVKRTATATLAPKMLEEINEVPSQESICVDKENNVENKAHIERKEEKPLEGKVAGEKKKRIVKKKVLTDKNEVTNNALPKESKEAAASSVKMNKVQQENGEIEKVANENGKVNNEEISSPESPTKPMERRKSRIFEQAEKFQNMISGGEKPASTLEKPKKISIPGVSVGGFKKEFERKASLTSPPKVKTSPVKSPNENPEPSAVPKPEEKICVEVKNTAVVESTPVVQNSVLIQESGKMVPNGSQRSQEEEAQRAAQLKNAVSFQSVDLKVLKPEPIKIEPAILPEVENKTSSAEITLKSATLPRRKTTKAEIQLEYPSPRPAKMEFRTEMAHKIEGPLLKTQKSEVIVPVNSPPIVGFRASSVEPMRQTQKERIIPISIDSNANMHRNANEQVSLHSPPVRPPISRVFQHQRSNSQSNQRSQSLSRQSTQESDSEISTITGEPIRKSPREYIIPIAVEGGGYVTPRAGSLEPSETNSTVTNASRRSFGRTRRLNSLFNERDGSEDESPFSTLHRHSSFGKDSDSEEPRKDMFHMHRLRSSRPRRSNMEHNDSVSSGEDDDDDGFESVTAENLFSTLLSRVRDLTQRINIDGSHPGFPSTRLLSHFGHESDFFNRHSLLDPRRTPLGRTFSRESSTNSNTSGNFGAPWRRSVSRDLASDIDSVYNSPSTPTQTSSLPRGDAPKTAEDLNLSDLDLKKLKLSEEDALALSYLTPGLSRRIQKQLLAQLPPSEARKLTRTLSMRSSEKISPEERSVLDRRSVDRISSTLPRRFSTDSKKYGSNTNLNDKREATPTRERSQLPVKSTSRLLRDGSVDRTRSRFSSVDRSLTTTDRDLNRFSSVDRNLTNTDCDVNRFSSTDSTTKKDRDLNLRFSSVNRSLSLKDRDWNCFSTMDRYSVDRDRKSDYMSLDRDRSRTARSEVSTQGKYYNNENSVLTKYIPSKSFDSCADRKSIGPQKRISRFLRPDFFDTPKENAENVIVKEKKEREMETQKVLKEIRDKRIKKRVTNRERSASAGKEIHDYVNTKNDELNENFKEIKHDYVNSSVVNNNMQKPHTVENQKNANYELKHDYINTKDITENIQNIKEIRQDIDVKNNNVNEPISKRSNLEELGEKVNCNKLDLENVLSEKLEANANKNAGNENGKNSNELLLKEETKLAYGGANKLVENIKSGIIESTELLKNISDNIQRLESNNNKVLGDKIGDLSHNYVNTQNLTDQISLGEKEKKKSKISRPKSYPSESLSNTTEKDIAGKKKETTAKSKIASRIQKVVSKKPTLNSITNSTNNAIVSAKISSNANDLANSNSKKLNASLDSSSNTKNKFLQSIERKFEKLRAFSNSPVDEKLKEIKEKSSVESAIRKLREHSLPKTTETCCTESGLIKRAVSVEDISLIGANKTLQPSRKSVTKILGLFKKYEDKDGKAVKVLKKKSSVKSGAKKESGKDVKAKRSEDNGGKAKSDEKLKRTEKENEEMHADKEAVKRNGVELRKSAEKYVENITNGTKSLSKSRSAGEKPKSKLPVTSYRRSLNLENNLETPQLSAKVQSMSNSEVDTFNNHDLLKIDERRRNLRLDLPSRNSEPPSRYLCATGSGHNLSYSPYKDNRNSYTTTDDSSCVVSPGDDDSWSVCSDFHRDLSSPLSPNGHGLSGDEGESVIDRIRRKSFYTRFNEKKKPRKFSIVNSYKDLDFPTKTADYGSLDRRSVERRSSYTIPDSSYKKEYKPYSRSSSLLNDGYVNVPSTYNSRYQTYNLREKRAGSLYSSDVEDSSLDGIGTTEKFRKYSYYTPSSSSRVGREGSSLREDNLNLTVNRSSNSISSPSSQKYNA